MVDGYSRNQVRSYYYSPDTDLYLVTFADGRTAYWTLRQVDEINASHTKGRIDFFLNPNPKTFSMLSEDSKHQLSRWLINEQLDQFSAMIYLEVGQQNRSKLSANSLATAMGAIKEYYQSLPPEDRQIIQERELQETITEAGYHYGSSSDEARRNRENLLTQFTKLIGDQGLDAARTLCRQVYRFSTLQLINETLVIEDLIDSTPSLKTIRTHQCQIASEKGVIRFFLGEKLKELRPLSAQSPRGSDRSQALFQSTNNQIELSRCSSENLNSFFKDLKFHFLEVPSPHTHRFRFMEGTCEIQGAVRFSKNGDYEIRFQRALPTDQTLEPQNAKNLDVLIEKLRGSIMTSTPPKPTAQIVPIAPAPLTQRRTDRSSGPQPPQETVAPAQSTAPEIQSESSEPGHAIFIPFTSKRR